MKDRARLSGRQKKMPSLSPAKAGLEIVLGTVVVLLGLALSASCNRRAGGGINSTTGGWPPASSSPTSADVSSSAQVVRVSTQYMSRSSSVFADVILQISPGYHINANPATYPYLIATKLEHGTVQDVEVIDGSIIYPPANHKKFAFADEPLAVYEGHVVINLPLKISRRAKGQTVLPVKVRVQ